MMSFKEFVKEITVSVQKELTKDYEIDVQEKLNVNAISQLMLNIRRSDRKIGTAVYLDEIYEEYTKAPEPDCMAAITDRIIRKLGQPDEIMDKVAGLAEGIENYQNVKDKILFKLVNTKDNLKLLEQVPHIPYLDLSVVFFICLSITEKAGMTTALIRNEYAQCWNITAEELYQEAEKNTPEVLPVEFKSLLETLFDISKDLTNQGLPISETDIGMALQVSGTPELYVLSNDMGMHGASVILYPDILKKYAEHFHSNLIVLPSSSHEVLLLPCEDVEEADKMSELVKRINETQVPREDWLSDHVYIYHYQENRLSIA